MTYDEFLENKKQTINDVGFDVPTIHLHSYLFGFQKHIVKIALQKGKYAIFADCGLGKTFMQLEWARHVVSVTNRPVLILAPLAVSGQTIQEGEKFGINISKFHHEDGNWKVILGPSRGFTQRSIPGWSGRIYP